jgi:hypothetical protein
LLVVFGLDLDVCKFNFIYTPTSMQLKINNLRASLRRFGVRGEIKFGGKNMFHLKAVKDLKK